jgi:carbamoyltransferase
VDDERNPRFAALLRAFQRKTGCPVLINTSFNARFRVSGQLSI